MTPSTRRHRPVNPIRAARQRKGLTLRELAAACTEAGTPITFSALSKLERGATRPLPKTAKALADVLGVDVVELIAP